MLVKDTIFPLFRSGGLPAAMKECLNFVNVELVSDVANFQSSAYDKLSIEKIRPEAFTLDNIFPRFPFYGYDFRVNHILSLMPFT